MSHARSLLLLAAFLVLGAVALPEHSEWRLAAGRTRRVAELIARLAAGDGAVRDAAEREIVGLGPPALPLLRAHDDAGAELETRLRLRRAARRIELAAAPQPERDRRAILHHLARREIPPRARLDRLGAEALALLVDHWKGPGRLDLDALELALDHAARHGGPDAGPFLVGLLGEMRVTYRALLAAGEALERHAGPDEIAVLRDIAEHEPGVRRAIALRVLFARGNASDLDRIANHLADPDRRVRIACTLLLWSPAHREQARQLLSDRDDRVRVAAASVLAETGREGDAGSLERLLTDRYHRVRMIAVDGLARRGRLDAVRPLRTDPSTGVQLAIRRAERATASKRLQGRDQHRAPVKPR